MYRLGDTGRLKWSLLVVLPREATSVIFVGPAGDGGSEPRSASQALGVALRSHRRAMPDPLVRDLGVPLRQSTSMAFILNPCIDISGMIQLPLLLAMFRQCLPIGSSGARLRTSALWVSLVSVNRRLCARLVAFVSWVCMCVRGRLPLCMSVYVSQFLVSVALPPASPKRVGVQFGDPSSARRLQSGLAVQRGCHRGPASHSKQHRQGPSD